jgi:hypothetical protein
MTDKTMTPPDPKVDVEGMRPENRALVEREPNVIHYDTMTANGRVNFCEMTLAALDRLLDAARAEGLSLLESKGISSVANGAAAGPSDCAATASSCQSEGGQP